MTHWHFWYNNLTISMFNYVRMAFFQWQWHYSMLLCYYIAATVTVAMSCNITMAILQWQYYNGNVMASCIYIYMVIKSCWDSPVLSWVRKGMVWMSISLCISPGHTHWHNSLCKAYCTFDWNSGIAAANGWRTILKQINTQHHHKATWQHVHHVHVDTIDDVIDVTSLMSHPVVWSLVTSLMSHTWCIVMSQDCNVIMYFIMSNKSMISHWWMRKHGANDG